MVGRRGSRSRATVRCRTDESRRPDVARDDRLELGERRRLQEVIVEPGFERAPSVLGVSEAGERDQHARPLGRTQPTSERVAVDVRKSDRDERERNRMSIDERHRRRGIEGDMNDPAAGLKQQLYALREIGIAIDHQQLERRAWNGHDRRPDVGRATPRFACTLADYVATARRVQYRRGTARSTS